MQCVNISCNITNGLRAKSCFFKRSAQSRSWIVLNEIWIVHLQSIVNFGECKQICLVCESQKCEYTLQICEQVCEGVKHKCECMYVLWFDIDTAKVTVLPLYTRAMNSLLCFLSNLFPYKKRNFFLVECVWVGTAAREKKITSPKQ